MIDQLKSAIITISVLLAILLGYILLSYDSAYEIDQALEDHLKGENNKAIEELNKLEGTLKDGSIPLYKAYIFRDEGNLQKSDELLEKAAAETEHDTKNNIRLEIYLNQAYNAYLQGYPEKMEAPLKQAEEIAGKNDIWVRFFTGLMNERLGKQELTTKVLEEARDAAPLSAWMRNSFKKTFSPSWFFSQKARKLIMEGQYVQARQLLQEGGAKQAESDEDDTNLLIGLTYLEEGAAKPPQAATPYYKLALSYFERVPLLKPKYQKERAIIINGLSKTSNRLIEEQQFQPLSFYADAFEKLKAENELNELSNGIIKMLLQEIDAQNWKNVQSMTLLLTRILPSGELRTKLSEKFSGLLKQALEEGVLNRIAQYWEAALAFSNDPAALRNEVSREIENQILSMARNPEMTPGQIAPYVAFWAEIEKNPKKREFFADRLVSLSEEYWGLADMEQKAAGLMQLAQKLPPPEKQFELDDRMRQILLSSFKKAASEEDYEKLPLIYDAAISLNLTNLNFQTPQETQEQLERARYLFANREYEKAKEIASWILRLYPKDEPARIIVGLSDYFEGNMEEAYEVLKTVPDPDGEIRRAIAISMILSGEEEPGMQKLEQLSGEGKIPMAAWLQLGFGKLMQGKPEEGEKWLAKTEPFNDEAYIGFAYADYLREDWEGMLQELDKLSPPYKIAPAAHALRLIALIHLGKKDEAEKELSAWAVQPDEDAPVPSMPFALFEEQRIAPYNKEYLSALYFDKIEKNPEKALQAIQSAPISSAEILLLKAKILTELEQYARAKENLEKAKALAEKNKKRYLSIEILPALAAAESFVGNSLEAYLAFLEYFSFSPNNLSYRPAFAKVLMDIRRFDLAAEEFEIYQREAALNEQESVLYLESLIRTDRFGEANTYAEGLLSKEPPLPPEKRVRIASLLTTTGDQELIRKALQGIPAEPDLDTSIEMIEFYTLIGQYEKAGDIIEKLRTEINRSPKGLMAEASLLLNLSRPEEALEKAHEAARLDPNNPKIQSFIEKHELNPELLEALMQLHQEIETGKKNGNYSQKLSFARLLIEIVIGMMQEKNSNQIEISSRLSQAYKILDDISKIAPGIPEIPFLQGQVYTLYDNAKVALDAYQKATVLDISYIEAYLFLALSYTRLGELGKAKTALMQALHFAPGNAEAWQQRALLEVRRGELIDALTSWKKAIHFRPNKPSLYIEQAKLLLELNNLEDAKIALEKALVLESDNIAAVKLLLQALYSPGLELNSNQRELQKQRDALLEKLEALSPEDAEEFRKKLDS